MVTNDFVQHLLKHINSYTGIKDDFHDVNDLIQQRKLQYFHWQRKEMLMQERVQKRL